MTQPTAHSLWRRETRALAVLAAPLAAANLLQMLVHAVDVLFVARLGEQALAAASLATTLFGLMTWVFSGLTGACAPLIGAELGRRAHAVREVRRTVRMALWLAVLCGLAGMAICLAGERLLLLTGQSPRVAALAGQFLGILMWAMIPTVMATVLRNFVSALGRPILATAITALAIVINALGNHAFIFGNFGAPALGLAGSAISSVITSLIMFAAYAAAIASDRRLRRYRIFGRFWRTEPKRFGDLVRIGTPIALIILAEAGLFSSAALLMGRLGQAELAAHTLALQITALAFQIPFGIGQAVTIRVGYHFGAGQIAAIGAAGRAALTLAICYMFVPAAAMIFAPQVLLSLYLDPAAPDNAVLVAHAVQFMLVAAAFQLFDGIQAVIAGALRGLQDTSVPMMLALFGYWVVGFGISLGLGLGTPLGGLGIWLGLAAGLVVVSILLAWRWFERGRLGLERSGRLVT